MPVDQPDISCRICLLRLPDDPDHDIGPANRACYHLEDRNLDDSPAFQAISYTQGWACLSTDGTD